MSSAFDPEGPLAQQLKTALISELQTKFGIQDDAEDVAEFILVLIGNNRTAADIVVEVRGLVDFPIDEAFVNTIFAEIGRLMQQGQPQHEQPADSHAAAPQQHQEQQQQQQQHHQEQQPPVQHQPQQQHQQQQQPQEQAPAKPASPHASFHPMLSFPNGPKATQSRANGGGHKSIGGSIGKGGPGGKSAGSGPGKKSFALQNAANFEKVMGLNGNVTRNTTKPFVQRPPKGRCPDFPYCANKECPLSHPTKTCFQYPNCPNPPGTCNYLHPDQDQDLMAKLEQSKKEFYEKKKLDRQQQYQAQQAKWVPPITLCKFGHHCAKEACPFGHPTPANQLSVVGQLEWCPSGKQCADWSCLKAHPSPSFQQGPTPAGAAPGAAPADSAMAGDSQNAPAAGAPASSGAPIPTLEQCKFGSACTNYKCPRRHATTPVPCRDGANCKRLDCFFSHPIDEDCRFGVNCTNKTCMFRHPDGRQIASNNTWTKDGAAGAPATQERQFAVPDDQVMEQAIQN